MLSQDKVPPVAFRAALSRKLCEGDRYLIIRDAMKSAGYDEPEKRTLRLMDLADMILLARDRRKAKHEST